MDSVLFLHKLSSNDPLFYVLLYSGQSHDVNFLSFSINLSGEDLIELQ
jgi:hypothetical protein